jgi:cytochrome oxidase Cu insertion factor (SCO1/SenC/PrrC family)
MPRLHAQTAQCKILTKLRRRGARKDPAYEVDSFGDVDMKVNDKAPDFTLQDENGKEIALKDLRGKTVILFFYPRANTPG